MDYLASAHAKLNRAREHLDALDAACRDYESNGPIALEREGLDDGRVGLRVKSIEPVPLEIPLLLGDFIHNLRSSLDHLVWSLVRANANQPSQRTTLPAHLTPDTSSGLGWHSSNDKKEFTTAVQGMSDSQKALIQESLGLPVDGAYLRAIHELDRIDKHRHLNLVTLVGGGYGAWGQVAPEAVTYQQEAQIGSLVLVGPHDAALTPFFWLGCPDIPVDPVANKVLKFVAPRMADTVARLLHGSAERLHSED